MTRRIRQRFWLLVLDAIELVPRPWSVRVERAYDWALARACDATDWGEGADLSEGSGEDPF